MTRRWVAALVLLCASAAQAHKPSDSYLTLQADGRSLSGRWDIALRDLDDAIGLDADGDGAITWGEVRSRHAAITAYAAAHLELTADGQGCAMRPTGNLIATHTDGAYAVLTFDIGCRTAPRRLAIRYRLFFDRDPQHRGLLRVTSGGAEWPQIFTVDQPVQSVDLVPAGIARGIGAAWWDGLARSWTMPHVLIVAMLLALLGALQGRGRRRDDATTLRSAPGKSLLAFALAQAMGLGLATLQIVHVPAPILAYGIAASAAGVALVRFRRAAPPTLLPFGMGFLDGCAVALAVAASDGATPPMRTVLAFNAGITTALLAGAAVITWAVSRTRLDRGRIVSAGAPLAGAPHLHGAA